MTRHHNTIECFIVLTAITTHGNKSVLSYLILAFCSHLWHRRMRCEDVTYVSGTGILQSWCRATEWVRARRLAGWWRAWGCSPTPFSSFLSWSLQSLPPCLCSGLRQACSKWVPHCSAPCLSLSCLALLCCIVFPCHIPCRALPCHGVPCRALPCLAFLPCPFLTYPALPYAPIFSITVLLQCTYIQYCSIATMHY